MKFLLTLMFLGVVLFSTAQNLQEAVNQKIIDLNIQGTGKYLGKSIILQIKNLTNKQIAITLDPGQFLQPEDSSFQRMMIAENTKLIIAANGSKNMNINAFCTQSKRHSPDSLAKFKLGKMADTKIVELAKIINNNRFFTMAAQNAIWCLTDNADIYSIMSDNINEQNILRNYVAKAKNQPLDVVLKKNKIEVEAATHVFRDTVRFVNREDCNVSLVLFDSLGNELITFIKPTKVKKNTNIQFNYRFTYSGLDYGYVFVRVRKNNSETIFEKKIKILE